MHFLFILHLWISIYRDGRDQTAEDVVKVGDSDNPEDDTWIQITSNEFQYILKCYGDFNKKDESHTRDKKWNDINTFNKSNNNINKNIFDKQIEDIETHIEGMETYSTEINNDAE